MIARTLLATLVLTFAVKLTAFAQDLPSAEDVINAYFVASGGKAKMESVKTQVQKGKLALTDMGMEADYTSYTRPPNSVNISDFEGMGVVKNGVTDGYAWSINPFQGNALNKANRPALIFPLLHWNANGVSAKVSGEESIEGIPCYVFDMMGPAGNEPTLYFAKDTGFLVQTVNTNDAGTQTTKLSDYKETNNGLKVPHRIVQEGGPFNITITLDSVEHDVEIPADTLSLPDELEPLRESAN